MRFGLVQGLVLAAVLIAGLPASANAQSAFPTDTWMVTGLGGVAIDEDGGGSLTIAGSAAYPIKDGLVIEGELGHVLDMSPDTANVDTSLTTVHGNLLYMFDTSYVLTPYLTAGMGVGKFSVDVKAPPADASTTEFGFNLGGGIFYPLGSGVSVRGDFRFFKHIDNVPSIWRITGGISVRIGS